MDERIKRIFRERFNVLSEKFEQSSGQELLAVSVAMDELKELYSAICGISYDAAATELHGVDAGNED